MADNGELENKTSGNHSEYLGFRFKDESGVSFNRKKERFNFKGVKSEYICIQRISQEDGTVLSHTYVFPNEN